MLHRNTPACRTATMLQRTTPCLPQGDPPGTRPHIPSEETGGEREGMPFFTAAGWYGNSFEVAKPIPYGLPARCPGLDTRRPPVVGWGTVKEPKLCGRIQFQER